ncbi:hypothetical protein BKA62DRAFT_12226 [Auriculariales sp. MPI-PUGE-AT-0066]|nr:hypothetical protein BKA62DRAFT_12226 [Auriculariales sp. MPI-PUGE-AT-0066]
MRRPSLFFAMSHPLPGPAMISQALLRCEAVVAHFDEPHGLRQIAMAVIIADSRRRPVLLRTSFGHIPHPGATRVFHPNEVEPTAPVYQYAMALQRNALRDQSARVVVAHEPEGLISADGEVSILLEMFEQGTQQLLCAINCGTVYSPQAYRAYIQQHVSITLPHVVLPQVAQLPPPMDVVFTPPDLLPSSSSDASSDESASPPEDLVADATAASPSDTQDAGVAMGDDDAVAEDLALRPMRFVRSSHVPSRSRSVPAELNIENDLMKLTEDWEPEERLAKRRLVMFKSHADGPKLNVAASTILQQDYVPELPFGAIVISCIFDAARDQHVATSVDILHLLECVLFAEHGIDERNRIRRNLEGLQPRAIAKGQHGSDSLFQLVMDFPDPKPRSIEKSLKVFRWSTLADALTKIAAKYSAFELPDSELGAAARRQTKQRRKDLGTAPYTPRSPRKQNISRPALRAATRQLQPIVRTASPSPEPQTPAIETEHENTPAVVPASDSYASLTLPTNLNILSNEQGVPKGMPTHNPNQMLVYTEPSYERRRIPSLHLPVFTSADAPISSPAAIKHDFGSRLSSFSYNHDVPRSRIPSFEFLAQTANAAYPHDLDLDIDGIVPGDLSSHPAFPPLSSITLSAGRNPSFSSDTDAPGSGLTGERTSFTWEAPTVSTGLAHSFGTSYS